MGNGIPPSRQYAPMYSSFQYEATVLNSALKSAISSFDIEIASSAEPESLWNEPNAVISALAAVSTSTDWGQSPDEHARSYMLGEKLAALCTVEQRSPSGIAFPATITIKVNGNAWPTTNISPPPTSPTSPASSFNIDEIWAQQERPEMFMLWACDPFVTPANLPWLGRLLEVVTIALPSMLFTIKARAGVQRPYEVNPNWPRVLPQQGHSSWPGGHAYVAGALGYLLDVAVGKGLNAASKAMLKKRLTKAARRIAANREAAGLHWTMDSVDGLSLGVFTMQELLQAAAASTTPGVGEISDLALLVSKV